MEDADSDIVPSMFSFCKDSVYGTNKREWTYIFTSAFQYRDGPDRFEISFAGIGPMWVVPKKE